MCNVVVCGVVWCVCMWVGWVLCIHGKGGWGVLEGWECIGGRETRENAP